MTAAALVAFALDWWPIILGLAGGAYAYLQGRSHGASKEKGKRTREEARARDVADEVDNDVGAMPPQEAREQLSRWSR